MHCACFPSPCFPSVVLVLNDIINCNVMSMARLCYIVLPQMIRRQKGLILNIGSLAGAMSTPTFTIYGATKVGFDRITCCVFYPN